MLYLVYLVAIAAEAAAGALAAGRRRMDLFGACVIAFVTALGGGTLRDIVLGRYPVGWTQHPGHVYLVVGMALATVLLARHVNRGRRLFLALDAMGLVAFSLIGSEVALRMGYALPVVVMAGMMTGIAGGVLRDVLCNQVPVVFRRELYAVVSLAVCLLFVALRELGLPADLNTAVSFGAGLALRLLAIWRGWRLPTFTPRATLD